MFSFRAYRPLDEDFIYHSWLASLDRSIRGVNSAVRPLIDSCVSEKRILVACSEDDSDHILGWLAWGDFDDEPVLLYVFVKRHLRGGGLATGLFTKAFSRRPDTVLAAFWSFWVQRYDLKRKWNLKYNALLLPVMLDGLRDGKAEAK